jgi:hypothetical protein
LSAFPAKKPNALWTIIEIANPAYVAIAIVLPIAVLIFALMRGDLLPLNFVHIITGALWTGIDIFMGIALGPAIGGLDLAARASIFKRITPKMTFLMPVIAGVASTAGIILAQRMGIFSFSDPKIIIALIIVTILTIQGFGFLLPSEISILKEPLSAKPDPERIGRLGMRNARLGGVQGLLQLVIIFVMAVIRF